MFFFFVCVCVFCEMSFKKENYRREPGGVQLFLLTAVLNQPLRKKKKVNSLTLSYLSMNFVFQEKCCGYFDIFLPVFRSPTL